MDVWTPDRDDPLSLAAWFVPAKPLEQRLPWLKVHWRDEWRRLQVTFHHQADRGDRRIHCISAYDGSTYYRLEFDPESLVWKLIGVDDGAE